MYKDREMRLFKRGWDGYNNQIFRKMAKSLKKKVLRCERHQFSLKPHGQYSIQPQFFQVSFCQHSQDKDRSSHHLLPCLNCPTFNRDNNFATPTFVLSSEQGLELSQGDRLREEHERRMFNYTDEKSELNVPKPRSKNNFCSVCRQNYADYLEHIDSIPHKKRIRAADFNKHILQLTHKFNTITINEEHSPKHNSLRSRPPVSQDESVQIISNPLKKIKTEGEGKQTCSVRPTDWASYPVPSQAYPVQAQTYPFNSQSYLPHSQAYPAQPYSSYLHPPPMDHLAHYNFNISMNLFLNQMPTALPLNPCLGVPDLTFQQMLVNQAHQMNHLASLYKHPYCSINPHYFPSNPHPTLRSKPITYIVIDE